MTGEGIEGPRGTRAGTCSEGHKAGRYAPVVELQLKKKIRVLLSRRDQAICGSCKEAKYINHWNRCITATAAQVRPAVSLEKSKRCCIQGARFASTQMGSLSWLWKNSKAFRHLQELPQKAERLRVVPTHSKSP